MLPSPVLQEDPHIEALQGYSDWEYYSDDYWDEDPSILAGLPQNPGRTADVHKNGSSKSAKKRKRTEESHLPSRRSKSMKTDQHPDPALYGPLWKNHADLTEEEREYTPGHEERVGLLKNWRDVFRDLQPRSDRRREENASVGKKRRVQWPDEDSEEQDRPAAQSMTSKTEPLHERIAEPRRIEEAEEGKVAENYEPELCEQNVQPQAPLKRRRKIEMEETQERQNGVVTGSDVTVRARNAPNSQSKKRLRIHEADESPLK